MRRRPALQGLTIRAVLILGFGLTLGLWLFAGYYFTQRLADLQRDAAAVSARYMQAQEDLTTIRSQVLLASVYVRDGLLDPDPAAAGGHLLDLQATWAAIDGALHRYAPVFDTAAGRRRIEQLRDEALGFHRTMLELLTSERGPSTARTRALLNQTIVPRRASITQAVEDVQAFNRAEFVEHQRATAAVYQGMQDRAWERLGLVLAASLGIALLATVYSGRLEGRLRHQQAKEIQYTRDLQHLSAKLISAQEEERRTIARELHDEIGQVLLAIKVELAYAQRTLAMSGGQGHMLDEAQSITDGALRSVRDLSQLLHPALLDDLGLPAAIDWYVRGFARRHPIETDVRLDGMDERLAPEIETAVYRIVQEALTNVAKHAHACTCRVRLRRLPDSVTVTIEDDGEGFDASAPQTTGTARGLGIVGIRERVSQLRGTLHLESGADAGTRLTVELPAHT